MPTTLFLADDNTTIQRVIELTFANEDIRVVSASDGEAAFRQIEAEPPDVVLADVGMPKLDGYGLAARIKNTPALQRIPVLLLAGAFEPIDEAKARASGCDGVLVKPLEPRQLVDRIKELLGGVRPPPLRIIPPPQPPAAVRPPIESRPEAKPEPKPEPKPVVPPASRPGEPAEIDFQREFAQLDAAFADLESEPVATFDDETASEFARDLDMYRGGAPTESEAPDRKFGDWDLPSAPGSHAADAPSAPIAPPAASAWDLEGRPDVPAPGAAAHVAPEPAAPAGPPPGDDVGAGLSKTSLASAFAALLAAEQALPQTARATSAPALSEQHVEDVVRRVLVRLTDETVHKIVLQTAERLIREEIQKIRSTRP